MPIKGLVRCFWKYTEKQGHSQVWCSRRGGPGIPSRTTNTNLDFVLVKNALFWLFQKLGRLGPTLASPRTPLVVRKLIVDRMLLRDFTFHHIDMACVLMETCGKFLYHTPTTRPATAKRLEEMMRFKTATNMDPRSVFSSNPFMVSSIRHTMALAYLFLVLIHKGT